jgi:hypothetical protein
MTTAMQRSVVVVLAVIVAACGARGAADPNPAASEAATSVAVTAAPPVTAPPAQAAEDDSEVAQATPQVRAAARISAAEARTPRALARALQAAERTIRDRTARRADLVDAAHEQQIAYRRLARRPRWRDPVVGRLSADLRPAARRNIHAGERLIGLVTPQPKLPDWRILRPAPADELRGHYRRAGRAFGIRWQYLAAIHLVETRMGRIRGTSTAGAQGPMQFMPATWAAYGRGDINDNGDAIMAAARYLAANNGARNIRRALWHYNHSDRYVDAISAYAKTMMAEPRTYRGYYHWQVYYMTVDGDVLLPVGYGR